MRALRLLAVYPKHLNLNGDVANREVLGAYLRWLGHEVEFLDIDEHSLAASMNPDFVIIGHGSIAAWNQISEDFLRLKSAIESWLALGIPMLAVSSGRDALLTAGASAPKHLPCLALIDESYETTPNRSEFFVASHASIAGGTKILGYLNSSVSAPVLDLHGSLALTSLHGPVLSRNIEWLHELANSLVVRAGGEPTTFAEAKANNEIARFSDLVEMIRQLELELAGE